MNSSQDTTPPDATSTSRWKDALGLGLDLLLLPVCVYGIYRGLQSTPVQWFHTPGIGDWRTRGLPHLAPTIRVTTDSLVKTPPSRTKGPPPVLLCRERPS